MQRHLDIELNQLKERLLRMSGLVEEIIVTAVRALVNRDFALAHQAIKSDQVINMCEIEIDELCLKLLALYQPQAGDLRFITSAMKITNDLERIGDLAVNIAQRALDLLKVPPLKTMDDLMQMAEAAQGMLKDSLNAFVNHDPRLAQDVCLRDDIVDDLNQKIFKRFLTEKHPDQISVERAIDIVLVAKNFERIADHSTNICEDVIYLIEGRSIKHHIADQMTDPHQPE